MQNLLRSAGADTTKAGILFQLSDYWSYSDSVRALAYARQALQLSKGDAFYTGVAHFYLGGVYFEYAIDRAQEEYMVAEEFLRKLTTPAAYLFRSRLWHNYGVLEQKKDNDKQFADILLNKALPFAERSGDFLRMAVNYMDLGLIFMNNLDYNKALDYYLKAIALLRHPGQAYAELGDCYTYAAKVCVFNKDYRRARPFLDSAGRVLSSNPVSRYLPAWYLTAGLYYTRLRQWDSASGNFARGLELANRLGMSHEAYTILYQQYDMYKSRGKFRLAEGQLMKVYDYLKKNPSAKDEMLVLHELTVVEDTLGHPKTALKWLMQYALLADSVFDQRTRTDIAALEAKYRSAEKEKRILLLQNENSKQKLSLQADHFNQFIYLVAIVIIVMAATGLGIVYHNRRRISLNLAVYNANLEGQEVERKRLAQDLHDGLGGMLAGVKTSLSSIAENKPQKPADMDLYKVINQLDSSVDELRRIARNLMPETLVKYGLEPSLRDLCDTIQTEKLRIVFQPYNISRAIIQQEQIMIYRIVQELVANAAKYARAQQILVQCIQEGGQMQITVEDNGLGFDVQERKGKGMGLVNVENRVNFLNGKMEIQSAPNVGTTINIEIYVHEG